MDKRGEEENSGLGLVSGVICDSDTNENEGKDLQNGSET